MNRVKPNAYLLLFLVVFGCWSFLIASLTPYGRFPDELRHVKYVKYIHDHRELPKLSYNISEVPATLAFHPPFYYLCAAVLFQSPATPETQLLVLRYFAVVQGILAVLVLWKCARLVFPENFAAVVMSMAFTVFNPQFVFIHSGAGNVPMTTLTCALASFLMIRILIGANDFYKSAAFLGITIGLALLSRTLTLYLLPPALLVLHLRAATRKEFAASAAILLSCMLLIAGWWYIGNWLQYGDPVLWKISSATVAKGWVKEGDIFDWHYFLRMLAFLHASFWAYFGRNEFHGQIWEYAIYLLLVICGLAGNLEIWRRNANDKDFHPPAFSRRAFSLLLLVGLLAAMELLFTLMKIRSPQGRYFYMAIVPISICLGAGLIKILPVTWRWRGTIVIGSFLFAFQAYMLLRYWMPHT